MVPESNVKRPGTGGVSIKTIPLFLAITALLLTAIVPLNSIGSEEAPFAENLPPVADAGEEIAGALMNDIIRAFKNTTFISIIGLFDVLGATATSLEDPLWVNYAIEAYIFIFILYFCFCFTMSKYSQGVEKYLNAGRSFK